ncbi:hypothetical protein [Dasania marina]|uniref:hypothetical protein n=1 Tax=Dasania marina TaxID=471499 RepID=UPI0030DA70A0|tara:strand:- start:572 stop:994 length:423 start_codon:yes stop_codon:yes gene_type:complete
MDFTQYQRNEIIASINIIDELEINKRDSFTKYDLVRFRCGMAFLISGLLMLSLIYDNAIGDLIGSMGVGLLPCVFLGSIIYFIRERNQFRKGVKDRQEAKDILSKLGLSYVPANYDYPDSQLNILATDEHLNLDEFKRKS